MIVCLCNGFNCRAVGSQIAAGASSVAQVFRGLGCVPQCGTCVHDIREMLLLHHGPGNHGSPADVPAIAAE